MIHRVKTFTEEDCNKIEKTVDDLDKLWVNRSCERRFSFETETVISRAPFWTLLLIYSVLVPRGIQTQVLSNPV